MDLIDLIEDWLRQNYADCYITTKGDSGFSKFFKGSPWGPEILAAIEFPKFDFDTKRSIWMATVTKTGLYVHVDEIPDGSGPGWQKFIDSASPDFFNEAPKLMEEAKQRALILDELCQHKKREAYDRLGNS